MAKNALTLFIRSLPQRCSFSIISFGDKFQSIDPFAESDIYVYDNTSKDNAIEAIERFKSNFGGTDIYKPLK